MKYSEPLSGQIWVFLAFLGVGFLLGALYLAFGFLRMLCGNGRRRLFCFPAYRRAFFAKAAAAHGGFCAPKYQRVVLACADVGKQAGAVLCRAMGPVSRPYLGLA